MPVDLVARWSGLTPRTRTRLLGLAIALLTFAAYSPVVACGFVWDDDKHLTANFTLLAPDALLRIWFEPAETPQYYPLVHTTFWLERGLWGLAPLGYHLVNVALHALSAVALWRLLARLALPGAWVAAAAFALHPVEVESVAWVTERKNTLSLLFALLSAHHLLPLVAGAEPPRLAPRDVLAGTALLVAGLLSKTVVCTLPAVLLVLAWWRQGRVLRSQVAVLGPLLLLGGAAGLLTAHLERVHVGASTEAFDLSLTERVLIAGRAAWFYLGKLAWPHPLSFNYPRHVPVPWSLAEWAWPVAAVGLVLALWVLRGRLGRGPLAAALIYGGVLLPALGFVDVYPFKYSFVADHFQYHASPAPIALAVAAAAAGLARLGPRATRVGPWLAAATLAALGATTCVRLAAWRDEVSLWRDTLRTNPGSLLAAGNLGARLGQRGAPLLDDPATAEEGRALLVEGRTLLRRALPGAADAQDRYLALVNLSRTEGDLGDPSAAAALAREAGRLFPRALLPHLEAGVAAAAAGDERGALDDLEAAHALAPDDLATLLALARLRAGAADKAVLDPAAALALAERAVARTRREDPEALLALAEARAAAGDAVGATSAAEAARHLAANLSPVRPRLTREIEAALARLRRREE